MTERICEFLRRRRDQGLDDGPCLVVDLDVVRDNYAAFAKALPDSRVFYAVKANPAPELLKLLAGLGSCFDTASVAEIEMALAAGAAPERISLRQHDQEGARHRARLRARRPPVRGRLQSRGGEDRPRRPRRQDLLPLPVRLRRRRMAAVAEVRLRPGHGRRRARACAPARARCLRRVVPCRLAAAPHRGLGRSAEVGGGDLPRLRRARHRAPMVNLGGGFPTKYLRDVPAVEAYGRSIFRALRKHFGNRIPETIIEPGRGMVGNAGVIEAEVVLVSNKSEHDHVRWVYLDIGKFGGLAETMGESIRYPIKTPRDGDEVGPCVLAGPTCDSADVLYEKRPYDLPISLEIGDKVLIEGTGAYTATYAAVAFNGFAPLRTFHI